MQTKLYQLIYLHDQDQQKETLPLSLGDSPLYCNNLIFRTIRDHFLKLGYAYTTEDFCHYSVLPYASLPTILKQKKVPYVDNVSVFRNIENRFPHRFNCGELIKVKPNYTLHESSHCIADHNLKNLDLNYKLAHLIPSHESQQAFKLIMAESYANAIESIANVFNTTPEQRLFYELNSYVTHNKKMNSILQQALDFIGLQKTFHLIYVSYIFSNSLNVDVSHKVFLQILASVLQDQSLFQKAKDYACLKKLFSHGFELSLDFRLQTTAFFCAFSGLNAPLSQLLKWNTVEIITTTSVIDNFLTLVPPA